MYKNIIKLALTVPAALSLAACGLIFGGSEDVRTPSRSVDVKGFKEIPVNFTHKWDAEAGYPYTGAAVIDVNNDGAYEVFIGGGEGQDDVLLSYQDGELKNIIKDMGLSAPEAAFGSASVDIDNDGDNDLVIARSNGVFVYVNEKGKFKAEKIEVDFALNSMPLSVAVGDINRDGLVDLYVSVFVSPNKFVGSTFNDPEHAKPNVLLLNKGDMKFEDITEKSKVKSNQNTFHSMFVDLNSDGYLDLVLAQNTGVIELFKNRGDTTFEAVDVKSGLGYWMGIGVGDIDNDGDTDIYMSNVGNSVPTKYLRGDLKEDQELQQDWVLLRNDGDFNFTNVAKAYELTDYGFAWGGVFEDLNLDGQMDLLVAQNYVKWPKHKYFKLPGKAFLQLKEDDRASFFQVDDLDLSNEHFGQSPLIVDLNADGKPDVFWINMNDEQKAYLNQSENHFIKVVVPDNAKYLGARISAVSKNGPLYTRQFVANAGLMTDSSNEVFFGLGKDNSIEKITVTPLVGEPQVFIKPLNDRTLIVNP